MFWKAPSTSYLHLLWLYHPLQRFLLSLCTESWLGMTVCDFSGRTPQRRGVKVQRLSHLFHRDCSSRWTWAEICLLVLQINTDWLLWRFSHDSHASRIFLCNYSKEVMLQNFHTKLLRGWRGVGLGCKRVQGAAGFLRIAQRERCWWHSDHTEKSSLKGKTQCLHLLHGWSLYRCLCWIFLWFNSSQQLSTTQPLTHSPLLLVGREI